MSNGEKQMSNDLNLNYTDEMMIFYKLNSAEKWMIMEP